MEQLDENSPIFSIGVAAELAMMHPQTLRDYDRMGLVVPQRTGGQTRRYTMRNIAQLREIARLSSEGVSRGHPQSFGTCEPERRARKTSS